MDNLIQIFSIFRCPVLQKPHDIIAVISQDQFYL